MNVEDRLAPEARAAGNAVPMVPPMGITGLKQFGGYIREEFLTELTGDRGRRIFDEMSKNDSTCGAILFAIKNLLRSLDWTVKSADPNDTRANEARDLLEGMLMGDMDHTWPEFIEASCSMFTFGFAMHEIVWKKRKGLNTTKPWLSSDFDDGLFAPAAFAPRSQKTIQRWIYDEGDHLLGFEQYPWDGVARVVPITRCLHFRTTAELDNPEGQSSLRTAYRSWYWLKRLQEIEGIGTERDLAGYPVLKVPGAMLAHDADPPMKMAAATYLQLLQQVRRDTVEGVMLPSDRDDKGNPHYEFTLLSSGGSRQLNISESISRYERAIARAVLADFIFLGDTGGGSLALGKTKVQFFIEAMKAYSHQMARQINEVAVAQIWRLNALDVEIMPTVEPGEIEQPDLAGLAAYLTSLVGAGFDLGTDVELENWLRSLADMPEAPDRSEDDDFDVMPSGRAVPVLPELDPAMGGNPEDAPPDKPGAAGPGDGANPGAAVEKALGEALRVRFGGEGFDMEAMLKAFEDG